MAKHFSKIALSNMYELLTFLAINDLIVTYQTGKLIQEQL